MITYPEPNKWDSQKFYQCKKSYDELQKWLSKVTPNDFLDKDTKFDNIDSSHLRGNIDSSHLRGPYTSGNTDKFVKESMDEVIPQELEEPYQEPDEIVSPPTSIKDFQKDHKKIKPEIIRVKSKLNIDFTSICMFITMLIISILVIIFG